MALKGSNNAITALLGGSNVDLSNVVSSNVKKIIGRKRDSSSSIQGILSQLATINQELIRRQQKYTNEDPELWL